MILRLLLSAALLWRVYVGDRWALVVVLGLMVLGHEVASYQLKHIGDTFLKVEETLRKRYGK